MPSDNRYKNRPDPRAARQRYTLELSAANSDRLGPSFFQNYPEIFSSDAVHKVFVGPAIEENATNSVLTNDLVTLRVTDDKT